MDFLEDRFYFCKLVDTELRKLSKSEIFSLLLSNIICEEEKLTLLLLLARMKFSCGGGFDSTVLSRRMLPICKRTLTLSLLLSKVKFDCGRVGNTILLRKILPIMFTLSLLLGGVKFDCVKFNCSRVDSAIPSERILPITLTLSLPLGGVKFDCSG
ncbi:11397_t:CDS:2, partial [Dentiscutata erythropus]